MGSRGTSEDSSFPAKNAQNTRADAQHHKQLLSMSNHPIIGHTSVYADDPQLAATLLARLIDGHAAPFPPHAGGWVCFLSATRTAWSHEFIEFYPRDTQLARTPDAVRPMFIPVAGGRATGAGSHVNLILPATAAQIEAACANSGRPHAWRWSGLMDVWLEERLMVELVPAA